MFRLPIGLALAAILGLTNPTRGSWSQVEGPRRGGNPDAAKIANPVRLTPASIASGKRTYQRLCALCHGPEGRGDGGGAGAGGQPADFTSGRWEYGGSDGEIRSVIRNGTSADMQGYSDQIADGEIWNLVNYLRSIGPQK